MVYLIEGPQAVTRPVKAEGPGVFLGAGLARHRQKSAVPPLENCFSRNAVCREDFMDLFYFLMELLATLTENIVAISAVTAASGPRFQGKKHLLLLWLLSAGMVVPITVLNQIQSFSFLTIAATMLGVIAVTKFLSQGGILIRSTACVITYFVIHTLDYIALFTIGLFVDASDTAFHTFAFLMNPGPWRIVLILFCKITIIFIYLAGRKPLQKIRTLPRKHCANLLIISLITYVVMSVLLNAIMDGSSVFSAQFIAILSWLLILLCMILIFCVIVTVSNYQTERQNSALLQTANQLMTQNYQQLHLDKQAYAKQLHDFQHHLLVLRSLAASGKEKEAGTYIDSLLSTAYHDLSLCHSGNDIIDAIINCKMGEAERENIQFHFQADFRTAANLETVDICGILANQIDNAFEACRKIPPPAPRIVRVHIKQVEHFAFFQVENTVAQNPFAHNRQLASTKTDPSPLHGLGMKNIRDIAAKYNGTLRNEYRDGYFVSTVSLCFEPLNT